MNAHLGQHGLVSPVSPVAPPGGLQSVTPVAPMTAHEMRARVNLVQNVMREVMQDETHYGVIPGTDKPSLWKPGAEVLCLTFRLSPVHTSVISADQPDRVVPWVARKKVWFNGPTGREFEWVDERGETLGFYEVTSITQIFSADGTLLAQASGSANNLEGKYRSQSVWDCRNTLRKIAEKRSFIAAVLMATGASDIFTQDLEDLDEAEREERKKEKDSKQAGKKGGGSAAPAGPDTFSQGTLTDKQVGVIKGKSEKVGLSKEDRDACITYVGALDKTKQKAFMDAIFESDAKAKETLSPFKGYAAKVAAKAAGSAPATDGAAPAAGGAQAAPAAGAPPAGADDIPM